MKIIKNAREHILKFKENHKIDKILLTLGIVFSSIFISGFTTLHAETGEPSFGTEDPQALAKKYATTINVDNFKYYTCSTSKWYTDTTTKYYYVNFVFYNDDLVSNYYLVDGVWPYFNFTKDDNIIVGELKIKFTYKKSSGSFIGSSATIDTFVTAGNSQVVTETKFSTNDKNLVELVSYEGSNFVPELITPSLLNPVKTLPSQIMKDGLTVLPIGLAVLSAVLLIFLVRRSIRLGV